MDEIDEQELQNTKLSDDERSERREGYLELMSQLQELKENATTGLDSTKVVFHAMNESNKLVNKVFDPQIISLDASLLSLGSDVLRKNVEAVDINIATFKPEEFCDGILLQLKHGRETLPDERNWKSLVEYVNKGFKVSHTPFFMCNNIDLNESIRRPVPKPRKCHVVDKEAEVKRPENVKSVEKEEDGIEESVQHIMGIIISEWKKHGKKPVCFFSLVVNPDSFSTTVENIFHFSFLVRDLMVDFIMGDEGNPCVVPTFHQESVRDKSHRDKKSQAILSISMQQWEEIKQLYNIKKAMITPLST